MDRKKELKQQYKLMKPEMGIFIIRSNFSNKYHLEATANLKGVINGSRFKLDTGSYPNRELQRDWLEHGAANFTIEILEKLEYDKDESKTDYSQELTLLRMIWEEKLGKEQLEPYKR